MSSSEKTSNVLKKSIVICSVLGASAAALVLVIFRTEPLPEREAARKVTAMLVETRAVDAGRFYPKIATVGTVVPARSVTLQAQVSGEIVAMAEQFVPGRFVGQGEVLARIDDRDYRNALASANAAAVQANTDLKIERGEQEVARSEYQRLTKQLNEMQSELVLRRPQLAAASAHLEAAQAAVAQAELALSRTRITAPFNAQIVERYVSLGSLVSNNTQLGDLVGIDSYWIEARLPIAEFAALSLPDANARGQDRDGQEPGWVKVMPSGRSGVAPRYGRVHSLLGAVSETSRLARVLIEIRDPLALLPENSHLPAIHLGEFVECEITAAPIDAVARVPRDLVRQNDTVWLMHDQQLVIHPLQTKFRDNDFLYVSNDFGADAQIVVTDLARVREGAPLRLAGDVDGQ